MTQTMGNENQLRVLSLILLTHFFEVSQAENLTEMLRSTSGFSALRPSFLRRIIFSNSSKIFFLFNFVCVSAFRNTEMVSFVLQTGLEW